MWKDAFIEVIKWIRESVRPVFVFFIVSTLLLFLPRTWAAAIGITEGYQKYHFMAFVLSVGSFVWLVSFPIERAYRRREKKERLRNLSVDEREILRPFVSSSRTAHEFGQTWVPATHLLVKDVILEIGSPSIDLRGLYHFSMELWILEYLREHEDLVGVVKPR